MRPRSGLSARITPGVLYKVHQARAAQKEEPQRHDGAKELADARGACLLHEVERADNNDGDGDHLALTVSYERVAKVDGSQSLDRRGNRYGGGQDAVG
jgi:hypothetical protein